MVFTSESKKAEKSLEISAFLVFSCLHLNQTLMMAGMAGRTLRVLSSAKRKHRRDGGAAAYSSTKRKAFCNENALAAEHRHFPKNGVF